jgi:hypothetical protein
MVLLSLFIHIPPEDISRRRPKLFAFTVVLGFWGRFQDYGDIPRSFMSAKVCFGRQME